jgi:hypothetical protein
LLLLLLLQVTLFIAGVLCDDDALRALLEPFGQLVRAYVVTNPQVRAQCADISYFGLDVVGVQLRGHQPTGELGCMRKACGLHYSSIIRQHWCHWCCCGHAG